MNTVYSRTSHDSVIGRIYRLPGGTLLSVGSAPSEVLSLLPLASGGICIRFAFPLHSQPHKVIVPNFFTDENGSVLAGREAWHYMRRHFDSHPFAKAAGWDANGNPEVLSLKEIDFVSPVAVLAYSRATTPIPVCRVDGLLIGLLGRQVPDVPELMARYLPVVADLERFLRPRLTPLASSG